MLISNWASHDEEMVHLKALTIDDFLNGCMHANVCGGTSRWREMAYFEIYEHSEIENALKNDRVRE